MLLWNLRPYSCRTENLDIRTQVATTMPFTNAPEIFVNPELEPLSDDELAIFTDFEQNNVTLVSQSEKNLDADSLRSIDFKIIIWPYGKGHYKIRDGCGGVCKISNKVKEPCCNRYAVVDILNPGMHRLDKSITKIRIQSHPIIGNVNQIGGIKFVYYEEDNIFSQTGICSIEDVRGTKLLDKLCFCFKEGILTNPNVTFR